MQYERLGGVIIEKYTPTGISEIKSGGIFDCLYDEYFTLIGLDDSICKFLGYTREEFQEKFHNHFLDVIYSEDREAVVKAVEEQLSIGNVFMYENRLAAQNGELYWVWVSAEVRENPDTGRWFHCIYHDITGEKKAQEELAISEQRYEIVLAQMQDIIFELDCRTFEIYYSSNFEKKFGYSIPSKGFPDSMFKTDIIYEEDKASLREKFHQLLQGEETMQQEYRIKKLDGTYLWVEAHAAAIRDGSGNLLKIIGNIMDIDDRKQEILEVQRAAGLDSLTGLFNRRECIRRIEEYIDKNSSMAAFLLIDVDNFKIINDTMGHAYGDSVLTELAVGLRTLFSNSDIIARLGGDEFVVFMTDIQKKEAIFSKSTGILDFFQNYEDMPETSKLSCSIGCSFYPEHGNTFSVLLHKADTAMYHAKKRGKAQFYIYDDENIASFGENEEILPARTMQKSFHDHIIEYVFRFFLDHPENAIAIPLLLEQLGAIFHGDRISIFERSDTGKFCSTFQWKAPGTFSRQEPAEQDFPAEFQIEYTEEQVITYQNINQIEDTRIREWFLGRKTKSAVICLLSGNGALLTAILYEDCQKSRHGGEEERYTLFMISEIIHLFLNKERNGVRVQSQGAERVAFLMDSIAGGMMGYYLEKGLPLYFINSSMLDFLGYDSQADYVRAIGGMVPNSIYEDDCSEFLNKTVRQLDTRNEYETEYRMKRKNGELIWVSCKGKKVVTSDSREAVICLCVDNSEQKEYQNQLALYRKASCGGAFIARMDETYTILYANDIFYDVYETTREALERLGNNCGSMVYPEDLPRVRSALYDACSHHKAECQCEVRIITGKGNLKWIMINGTFEQREDGLVMNGFVIDLTEKRMLENEIAHKELVYRTALKETHINVWEYDIKAHTLHLTESAEAHHAFKGQLAQIPQSLLDYGYVNQISSGELLRMYRELDEGAAHAQADILTLSSDGSRWWWERIHYTMIYDKDGQPDYAVAIGEDITRQKEAEALYQQDLRLGMTFNENRIASFRCNLTTNYTEYAEGENLPMINPGMTYEELFALHCRFIAAQEDVLRVQNIMSREVLLDDFAHGKTSVTFDYRRKDGNGRLSWVCATVRLIQNSHNGNLYAYGVLEDITEKKNMEFAMKNRVERDPLTGVYNKDTAIQMITGAMKKAHRENESYALLIANVDRFTRIVHENGYALADGILKEIANQLLMRFTGDKIVGRFYGDEFMVYIYNNPKPDQVRRYTEEFRRAIAMPYLFPDVKGSVSISAGIVFDNDSQSTFDDLYNRARLALIAAKESGRNNYQIYSEQQEKHSSYTHHEQAELRNRSGQRNSSQGVNILLKCMYSITSSMDFKDSLENTLKELGSYYDGDRAYVIELERKERKVYGVYEWKKEEVLSIQDTGSILLTPKKVSEKMHSRLRKLSCCGNIEELKLISPDIYEFLKQSGINSYMLATLDEKNYSVGYIGIDNPKRNTGDTTVINTLRYVLTNELAKRRLQDKQQYLIYHDELTGVLNRNSFKEYRENLSEEGLISIGVVSLDINGLRGINHVWGNAYGDDIVYRLASILEGEFSFSRVYRFSGDEFLIVCENISMDSFRRHVEKLKERSSDICSVSMGSAWSDTDIQLDSLIHNADEQRMIAKQKYYDERETDSKRWNGDIRKDLLESMKAGYFCIFLQPKFDSRSDRLYGAEALIRCFHPTDGLVMPMKFVPHLEQVGLIHYIDFFVMEQVCRTLKKWSEKGLALIPISLNFSRFTLLDEELISRMDAIADRYGIDRKYLEIEITESFGNVERSTIARIGNQIRQAGYLIALDDFGAKYSNISFLSILRFNHLKLDKGLVNNLITNESARLIVENIMNLCRGLDVRVIAEGVENREQLEILKELQCYYIQGFYYDKPSAVETFEARYMTGGDSGPLSLK